MHSPWQPGESGNPGGRRVGIQKAIYDVMNVAGGQGFEALSTLRRTALNPGVAAAKRRKAAEAILNRAYGNPELSFQILLRDNLAQERKTHTARALYAATS